MEEAAVATCRMGKHDSWLAGGRVTSAFKVRCIRPLKRNVRRQFVSGMK